MWERGLGVLNQGRGNGGLDLLVIQLEMLTPHRNVDAVQPACG